MIRKFDDYIKFRESEGSADTGFAFGNEDDYEPIKIAWKRYRARVIDFLKELDDPEIAEALNQVEDGGENKEHRPKGIGDDDNSVVVPKSDGNPGMEDGGWD